MKRFFSILSTLAVLFLVSCQKEVSIADNHLATADNHLATAENAQAEQGIPFKGFYTTTAQRLQPPPIIQERITGTGQATYLGQSTFVATVTVNLTTAPPFAVSGTAVFTAANGDQFYTHFAGTSTPNADGTSTGVLHHTVTGGTGRFENATGNITGVVHVNPASPTNSVVYTGEITVN
jgi:hypothetical protein